MYWSFLCVHCTTCLDNYHTHTLCGVSGSRRWCALYVPWRTPTTDAHTHTHTHTHRYYLNHPDARYNAAHDASDDIEADGPLYKAGSDTNAPLTDEVRSFGPAYRAYSPPLSVRLHYSMERDFPLMRPSPNVFITDCPQDDTEVTGYMDFEGAAACDETQDDTEVTGYMDVEGHAAGDEDEDVEA